ncbi:MAG: aromatic acid exporter family protein, partial [Bacillota bacterium]
MKRYLHTTIKMSLASVFAILLAELFQLNYPITAGILAVLSVQLTRTDSINLAIKRFLNALIAIALFTLFFVLFNYTVYIFVLVTVLFIAASFALKLEIGIVPSLVLTSHLLLFGSFDWFMISNSVLLIGIAGLVSLILNLVYPLNSKQALSRFSQQIDSLIIKDLRALATLLKQLDHLEESRYQHAEIRSTLKSMLKEAELVNKDILFTQDRQLMSYIKMRYAQMKRIHRI